MKARQADRKALDWRSVAVGFLLGSFLAIPITVVATMANSPSGGSLTATIAGASGPLPLAAPSQPNDAGDVGSFAHGYLEFDSNPSMPGGVAGFDSWPPGSSRR